MKKHKVGIVLGGGGTRGFAHLGVIKALKEKGIEPGVISGASAGAIAGSLIADGKSPEKALEILKNKGFFNYTKLLFPRFGFFSFNGLYKELETSYSVKKIEELKLPFYSAVTNINTGKVEYHNSGILTDFVIASASIPILFNPIKINGQLYTDGGLSDNLPLKPLIDICEKIIVVNIVPVKKTNNIKGLKHIIGRTLDIVVNCRSEETKKYADLFIEPTELRHYPIFNTKKADEVFNIGYEYTKNLDLSLFFH